MQPTPTISPEAARQIGDALAENGRVLATLDDWRAMLFGVSLISVVVVAALIFVIIILLRSIRQERSEMSARLDRALAVSDKFGDAAGKLSSELQVQQALNARVETSLGRVEELLTIMDQRHGTTR